MLAGWVSQIGATLVGLIVVLGCAALLVFVCAVVWQTLQRARQRALEKEIELEMRRLGERLEHEAALFAESPETYRALFLLALSLQRGNRHYDAHVIQGAWRKQNERALMQ